MRLGWSGWLVGAVAVHLAACASAPPPPPPPPDDHLADDDPTPDAGGPLVVSLPPERARPASTATYDEALSTPESLDVNDDRAHLTDGQLTGPMRGVLDNCRVPATAKVTIKTAVQNGRAIGVTTIVVFDKPRSTRPPSYAVTRAEAKIKARIISCADRAVRAVTWPPSRRRDSFTTVF